jgi:hypothetical protein
VRASLKLGKGRASGAGMSYDVIRQAILDRRSLTATYDGAVLHFSPHVLGRHPDRSLRVVAFQYVGDTERGRWRCLALGRLERVGPNRDGWHSGHDRGRPTKCVVQIEVASW